MFYFVFKISIGGSMVRIFKGRVGLGGGEEPACEPPLSGEEYIENFKHSMEGKSEKIIILYLNINKY